MVDRNYFIPCADFAFAENSEVKTAEMTGQETLDHIVAVKFQIQFEAGEARLRDNDLGRANREAIANANVFLKQTRGRKVFAESSPGKVHSRQCFLPEWIVFRGIGIGGLVLASMNGQIRLSVAFEIQVAQSQTPFDGRFKDSRRDFLALQIDEAGHTYL
jgi:hypothetical protein